MMAGKISVSAAMMRVDESVRVRGQKAQMGVTCHMSPEASYMSWVQCQLHVTIAEIHDYILFPSADLECNVYIQVSFYRHSID